MGWPFGRSHPADEGLSRKEIQALEKERLFPSSTIRDRGKTAKRTGKEASAQGFFTFGRKVMHDPKKQESQKHWLW